MREEESDFSCLKTVSTFDKGNSCTLALDVTSQDLQKFSPPSLFVESLLEQLCKLIDKDPRSQRKLYLAICQKLHQMNLIDESYKMEEFQFMRSHYQKALYHFLTVAKSTSLEPKAIYPTTTPQVSLTPEIILEWSRYSTEFQELRFLAKGGFGHVYKVRHKLDGQLYAIKKICLHYRNVSSFLKSLREVKMLAKLNHPNIVAYKAAWLEPLEPSEKQVAAITEAKKESTNGDSLEVVFENSGKQSENGSVSQKTISENSSEISRHISREAVICEYKSSRLRFKYPRSQFNQCATLYIQMQLCKSTLRDWLDERNLKMEPINMPECIDIFKQVVKGVEYIHSQGIVHHDIKPSNIFLSEDRRLAQVGDFGLSCRLLAHSNSPLSVVYTSHQPGQFGTEFYAAPEQLRDTCHPKSDVYSLGIVLLELIQPFNTAMERSKVIGQLKLGHIPTEVTAAWPNLARIISQTMIKSLKRRPTSSELFASIEETESVSTAKIIENQEETIRQLKEENLAIREENIAKDKEIAQLKQELQRFISNYNLNF